MDARLALALVLIAGCSRAEPAGALRLADATARSGLDVVLTSGRTPPTQILEVKGGGLALFDLEGDGDLDVFVPNGATLDSPERGPGARLFRNEGGLVFEDATRSTGLAFERWGMGVAAGDATGDGQDDLFVSCFGQDALLVNGGGRLAERDDAALSAARAWSTGCAFGDFERDGDLDLYVAGYLVFDPAAPPPASSFFGVEVFGGPAGLTPEADRAFANRGDGRFDEVTAQAGFDRVAPAFGLCVAILDLDGDGWQDVFVGNDSLPNFLFLGRPGGVFSEQGLARGIALSGDGQPQATMGIAIGDVDGDGAADVFTTNFASDTNTLWVARGDGGFADRTAQLGLGAPSRPFLGWGCGFVDLDHDGDEDLLAFNGHVYPGAVTERLGVARAQVPLCFERVGARFEPCTAAKAGAWLAAAHVDRSAAFGDLDGDGDVDVLVAELNGPLRLLENKGARGDWLVVSLRDARAGVANRRGLGSRVELVAGDERQVRWIHSGGSYLAASWPSAHFGLGAGGAALSLSVTWPDGVRQEHGPLEPRRHVVVERTQ